MAEHLSEESVFNMAFAYLERINKLLYYCQQCAIRQDIDQWITYLRALQREMSIKLDDKELEQSEINFKKVFELMKTFEMKHANRQKILISLHNLEISIRRIMQKKNMLLPSKSDPRFAVLRR